MEEFSSYIVWLDDNLENYEVCDVNDSRTYFPCSSEQQSYWLDFTYYTTKLAASASVVLSSGYLMNKGYLSPKFLQWGAMLASAKVLTALSPFELFNKYIDITSLRSFIVGSNVLLSQALTNDEVSSLNRITATVMMSLFTDSMNFIEGECIKLYNGMSLIEPMDIVDDAKHLSFYALKNGGLRIVKEVTKSIYSAFHLSYLEHIIPEHSFINNWCSTFISTFISDYCKFTWFEKMDFFKANLFVTQTANAGMKGLCSAIAKQYDLSSDIIASLGVLGGQTVSFILNNWFFDEQVIDTEQ